ncbi:MAG: hypothetical protein ACJAS1_002618 [Oleiphilaceae bacterium]|jgi:hypothetical protein
MSSRGDNVDDLIYPICFNMRHSIELRLKGAIEEIINISKLRGINLEFDLNGSHDIGNIWEFFQSKSNRIDRRFEKINYTLHQTIRDIADIDATGQTFRYPIDSESKKHLVDVGGIINCRILFNKFIELEKNLDTLHYLTGYLQGEYQLLTFTRNLSRANIFEIAKKLPPRSEWSNESFKDVKLNIRSEYGISSNELSKLCNLIQTNYETAYFIQLDLNLMGINEDKILELLSYWVKLNPNFKDRSPKVYSLTTMDFIVFEGMKERDAIKIQTLEALRGSLTPEYLADLNALFYFARDLDFSENYKVTYNMELKGAKLNSGNEKEVARNFLHIFSKCNLIDNILQSLYFLNFINLAEKIVELYELEGVFEFLTDVRSRECFVKSDICGY